MSFTKNCLQIYVFIRLGFWKQEAIDKSQENSISLTPYIHVRILQSRPLTVNYDTPLTEIFHIFNPL
jgi:hypothetical protein